MKQQRVWIVGASSGIGEAIARHYAKGGFVRMVISARNGARLALLSDELSLDQRSVDVLPITLDVTQEGSIDIAVEKVLGALGGIDVVIYCAGVSQRSLACETTADVDRKLIAVNYFGATDVTRAVLPSMLHQGWGHIAVIGSVAGKIGTPLRSSYAASKHALHGYFDSLRAEVHDNGIRVLVVDPGFIRTDITLRSLTGDGTPYGKIDRSIDQGMAVDKCATLVVRAIDSGKSEVIVSGLREKLAVVVRQLCPNLIFFLTRILPTT